MIPWSSFSVMWKFVSIFVQEHLHASPTNVFSTVFWAIQKMHSSHSFYICWVHLLVMLSLLRRIWNISSGREGKKSLGSTLKRSAVRWETCFLSLFVFPCRIPPPLAVTLLCVLIAQCCDNHKWCPAWVVSEPQVLQAVKRSPIQSECLMQYNACTSKYGNLHTPSLVYLYPVQSSVI